MENRSTRKDKNRGRVIFEKRKNIVVVRNLQVNSIIVFAFLITALSSKIFDYSKGMD